LVVVLDEVQAVLELAEDEEGEVRVGAAAGEPASEGADRVFHRGDIIPKMPSLRGVPLWRDDAATA